MEEKEKNHADEPVEKEAELEKKTDGHKPEGTEKKQKPVESKEAGKVSESTVILPEETGLRQRIKNEIKNTPRPKKILVSTILASMTVVSILGFGVYGLEGTAGQVSAVQTEEEKKEPAKLILKLDGKNYELDLWQLGYDGKNPGSVDIEKITKWLDNVRNEVRVEPKNARFEDNRWGKTIIRGEYGKDIDVKKMEEWLKNWHTSINRPYQIPMVEVKPEVTSSDLRKVHLNLVGSYTTRFNPGNVNRTTNMKLSSNSIHNLVLLPGETFSFNEVVGERTEERGYKTANVIVRGEYTDGIGGGICQVSSTLYNSTDRAGLKMLSVVHHSADVEYVPKGRDATVSWGGPDFRFQNNLDAPILLRIFIEGGKLTANVYTVPGAKVKKRNVEPAPESFTEVVVDQQGKEVPQS